MQTQFGLSALGVDYLNILPAHAPNASPQCFGGGFLGSEYPCQSIAFHAKLGLFEGCEHPLNKALPDSRVNRIQAFDFYDIHALLQHRPLTDLVSCFARKYADSEPFMLLRSLTYFDDAEQEPDPISLQGLDWPSVKRDILAAVRNLPA